MFLWDWIFRRGTMRPLGWRGERLAARFVRKRGMKVLARNVLCPHGELDLVALDGEEIVFIEVRTLTTEEFQTPEQSMRRGKRQRGGL